MDQEKRRLPPITGQADPHFGTFDLKPDLFGFAHSFWFRYPQSVSVFVDGVRVNEPDASQVNFNMIPVQAVERSEVIRNPGGAFGRNTMAGAINVITRRGEGSPSGEPKPDSLCASNRVDSALFR